MVLEEFQSGTLSSVTLFFSLGLRRGFLGGLPDLLGLRRGFLGGLPDLLGLRRGFLGGLPDLLGLRRGFLVPLFYFSIRVADIVEIEKISSCLWR
jgi:hypothetical protein